MVLMNSITVIFIRRSKPPIGCLPPFQNSRSNVKLTPEHIASMLLPQLPVCDFAGPIPGNGVCPKEADTMGPQPGIMASGGDRHPGFHITGIANFSRQYFLHAGSE
jgi:hypothetical protein